MRGRVFVTTLFAAALAFSLPGSGANQASANDLRDERSLPMPLSSASATSTRPLASPSYFPWMHPDVRRAWGEGYVGQGTHLVIVDDFLPTFGRFSGNLDGTQREASHGAWVRDMARMLAPEARVRRVDFIYDSRRVRLPGARSVINLSYATLSPNPGERLSEARERSIVGHATLGRAVVVKAAGNFGHPILSPSPGGLYDILARDLAGARSVIFAGATEGHGTARSPTRLTDYSSYPGDDLRLQRRFVTVGVRTDLTELAGTSFAAPQISGYAAIIWSKFADASARDVVQRILRTARRDVIVDYDPFYHGRGQASLGRALAPDRIR